MTEGTIRLLALCVFFRQDEIFVSAAQDRVSGQVYYRPLGGEIAFSEPGRDTVARKLREEIGAEIGNRHLIDTLENICIHEGAPRHELVQVYAAEFADPIFYELDVVCGQEGDPPLRAVWKPLADFTAGCDSLYPAGLTDILRNWVDTLSLLEKHYQPAAGEQDFDWEGALRELRE